MSNKTYRVAPITNKGNETKVIKRKVLKSKRWCIQCYYYNSTYYGKKAFNFRYK